MNNDIFDDIPQHKFHIADYEYVLRFKNTHIISVEQLEGFLRTGMNSDNSWIEAILIDGKESTIRFPNDFPLVCHTFYGEDTIMTLEELKYLNNVKIVIGLNIPQNG